MSQSYVLPRSLQFVDKNAKSDQYLNSPCNITAWSSVQVRRVKEIIIKLRFDILILKLTPQGKYGEK